jgi:small subunit ribosomal protein S9
MQNNMPEEPTQGISEEKSTSKPRVLKKNEYLEGVGRRKRSTARVRIWSVTKSESSDKEAFKVNQGEAKTYFQKRLYDRALEPLTRLSLEGTVKISATVRGGGITGQAEAVRMGLSRALVALDPIHKGKLTRAGLLTRDSREKERRKFGLKKARRAPQFSKR